MGYADKTSLTLGTLAAKFQNIADTEISAGDAALFINSQMKAFNITASDAEHILDAVNETANNFAVGTNDLQGALTVAGSSMSTVGNTFEETIGLITAATELMPGKAQTVGNSFRTIGINIANMANSTDSWVAANGRINVALKDSQGNLRSTYDIMQDLNNGIEGQSVAWKDLTEAEQNEIALAAGGKTRYQAFVAAMNNFGTAVKATETALNSEGSAAEENAKYMDSLEGTLQRLRSAWERFSTQILNSDTIKTAINLVAGAMDLLSSKGGIFVAKSAGIVAGVTAIGKAFRSIKGAESVGALLSFLRGTGGAASEAAKGAEKAGKAMNGYAIRAGKAGKQSQSFAKGASKAATAGAKVAGNTSKLGKVFGLLGTNVGMAAAALGVYAGVKVGQYIYKQYQETHKAEKATKELTKSNKERIETTEEEAQQARDYLSELGKLEKVENKTAYQKRKMADIVKELNKIYPELNLTYDKNTDTLSSNSDELKGMIDEASKLSKMDAYEKNAEDAEEASKKTGKSLKKSKKEIQDYIETINDSTSKAARRAAGENLRKAVKQYQTDFKESAKQWRESIKYYNKAFLMTDDWTNLVEQYESLGKEIPESVIKGINKGIYEAPDTVEGMESLVKWDQLISDYEHIFGKTIPATIQKALADGIYDMPTTTYELEDLIKFETSREGLEALGVDLSDSFIKGFQSQGTGIRQKFNELLTNILKVDPKKASEIFAYQDWGFDTMFNDLQADAEGRPISLKVQLSSTDDVKSRINTIRKELGNLEEGQDITIGVKDEATGEIQAITITAEDFEKFRKMVERK